eukprot:3268-Chlamydomonas_euryale.AAC.1
MPTLRDKTSYGIGGRPPGSSTLRACDTAVFKGSGGSCGRLNRHDAYAVHARWDYGGHWLRASAKAVSVVGRGQAGALVEGISKGCVSDR